MSTYELPLVTDDELLAIEKKVQAAQENRSLDGLNVYGFGEVSIALGWPTEDPRFIAKRMVPSTSAAGMEVPWKAIHAFTDGIEASEGKVLPFETRSIRRSDGNYLGYIVQPIVPKEELAETVLKTETPQPFHPLLIAVRDFVVDCSDDNLALDAQIPNFAWKDGEVQLLDISSPAWFDSNGKLDFPSMNLATSLVPTLIRPAFRKGVSDILALYRGKQGSLTQTVVFLNRIGAQDWIPAAIETFNEVLDEPIEISSVNEIWAQNVKDFPRVKKMCMAQRSWQEKVRRKPYEFLIMDSMNGKCL